MAPRLARARIAAPSLNARLATAPRGDRLRAIDAEAAVVAYGDQLLIVTANPDPNEEPYDPSDKAAFAADLASLDSIALHSAANVLHADGGIRSIALARTDVADAGEANVLVAQVDGTGRGAVTAVAWSRQNGLSRCNYLDVFNPAEMPITESWSGVAFHPQEPTSSFVTVNAASRAISQYAISEAGITLNRAVHAAADPSALTYVQHGAGDASSSSQVLLLTERASISLWDLRASKALVAKEVLKGSDLLAATSSGNYFAVAGADRMLTVFDARKITPVGMCMSMLKYEVSSIAFSHTNANVVYAASGSDSELAGCRWDSVLNSAPRSGVTRGHLDGRCLGMDVSSRGVYGRAPLIDESVFFLSTSGMVYLLREGSVFATSDAQKGATTGDEEPGEGDQRSEPRHNHHHRANQAKLQPAVSAPTETEAHDAQHVDKKPRLDQ
ncbi:hypothetical protein CAOG_02428 [Capsaspora owczarzaki ATCC 30864]|uniref:Uncharacterized protein n=1 Tax=Capsaspora owczarzaki (strain ATCC 30864) TaxID=595528 RepID=A0A0D2WMB7_CAPO3|nr:hypothetical protein CAOG_02428 [Capsaspora owczarzaki ATCC 30864]KJE91268.1 hypothetical protein CAOG_002428 [Capsaspora owczarzaki ATCC 30864]|eukprot:XP_004349178.1 hypothetical protein CAOG_02428 [Capsaspora owczarzaki ATCC 30864]